MPRARIQIFFCLQFFLHSVFKQSKWGSYKSCFTVNSLKKQSSLVQGNLFQSFHTVSKRQSLLFMMTPYSQQSKTHSGGPKAHLSDSPLLQKQKPPGPKGREKGHLKERCYWIKRIEDHLDYLRLVKMQSWNKRMVTASKSWRHTAFFCRFPDGENESCEP